MASAFGYPFIFASIVFYTFIGFLLTLGLGTYLVASIPDFSTITAGNFLTEIYIVFTNPLSAYGFLAWLSVAIFITDVFIFITSVLP